MRRRKGVCARRCALPMFVNIQPFLYRSRHVTCRSNHLASLDAFALSSDLVHAPRCACVSRRPACEKQSARGANSTLADHVGAPAAFSMFIVRRQFIGLPGRCGQPRRYRGDALCGGGCQADDTRAGHPRTGPLGTRTGFDMLGQCAACRDAACRMIVCADFIATACSRPSCS